MDAFDEISPNMTPRQLGQLKLIFAEISACHPRKPNHLESFLKKALHQTASHVASGALRTEDTRSSERGEIIQATANLAAAYEVLELALVGNRVVIDRQETDLQFYYLPASSKEYLASCVEIGLALKPVSDFVKNKINNHSLGIYADAGYVVDSPSPLITEMGAAIDGLVDCAQKFGLAPNQAMMAVMHARAVQDTAVLMTAVDVIELANRRLDGLTPILSTGQPSLGGQ